jgi:hypothetical protein
MSQGGLKSENLVFAWSNSVRMKTDRAIGEKDKKNITMTKSQGQKEVKCM